VKKIIKGVWYDALMMKRYKMKMKQTKILKFFTLLISTSFLCTPSFGAEPLCKKEFQENPCDPSKEKDSKEKDQSPVTLQETLERTYMQNATLDAARAGLRATDETLSQANADWRPSLSVRGFQIFQQTNPIDGHGEPRRHTHDTGYEAAITQNIYKGGQTVANIGVKESNVFAAKAGLFSTEQNILFSAMKAHADVIANQDIVKYLQDSVSFYKKFLERAEARFEVGDLGRTSVEAARAEYEGAKGDLSEAIGRLEASKADYYQIVASSPENLKPANILLDIPKTYEDALEVAKNNNPSITEARFALEAAQYNVDLQIGGLLPDLGVSGTVGNDRRGGTGFTRAQKQTSLGARADINVPIYSQGIPNSKIREAYQQVAQQKVSLVQVQRDKNRMGKSYCSP
jgi:outer membrane protein